MIAEAPLLFAAAAAFAVVSGVNDGGALLASGLQLRSLRPLVAIAMLALAVLTVPLIVGTAVATTLATALVDAGDESARRMIFLPAVAAAVIVVAVLARFGLPTSLTLALIGGITGVGVGRDIPVAWGAVGTVLAVALAAPIVGGLLAWLLIRGLRQLPFRPAVSGLGWAHRVAYGGQCLAYGANDGQKALAVFAVAAGTAGPSVAPRIDQLAAISVLFSVGVVLGLPRIAGRLGRGVTIARPVQAVSAEAASAVAVLGSAAIGSPVSMTQSVSGALVGAGLSSGYGRVRWRAASHVAVAWVVTLPAALILGAAAGQLGSRLST